MDKNSVIGIILIIAVLFGFTMLNAPSKEEREMQQRRADSIAAVNQQRLLEEQAVRMAEAARVEQENQVASTADADYQSLRNIYGTFASSVNGDDEEWTIENNVLKMTLSRKGGMVKQVELKEYVTWDSLPLINFDGSQTDFNLSFALAENRAFNSNCHYFVPYVNGNEYEGPHDLAVEGDSIVFSLRLFADMPDGAPDREKYIEYVYTVRANDYMVGFDIKTVNMKDLVSYYANYMTIDWTADLLKQEKNVDRFNGSTIYYKASNDDVESLDENKDDEETVNAKIKWISFKQRFFCNTLIAGNNFDNARMSVETKSNPKNEHYLKTMKVNLEFDYRTNESEKTIPMSFYFGPNKYKTLRAYGLNLERQIYLGGWLVSWINRYIVIPVFNWLGSYGWNYGIVILVLTVLLKIILLPIAYRTYMSSAIMRALKPEMEEISARYPKEEDAMKKQQAVMTLYKQAGASPMSGCLPMLLQMPILIALFRFFPASIELRQQPFLWATDLSSYDSILDLPFKIPFYGDHVSLFCLLMTISTIIYTYVNNKMMSGTQNDQQMKSMKIMMYIMPIMFLGIFNDYASGLSYYYLLVNLITFLQMFLFRLFINEDKLRLKIERNKKKPVKKTAFQKRLEEAQKQAAKQQKR